MSYLCFNLVVKRVVPYALISGSISALISGSKEVLKTWKFIVQSLVSLAVNYSGMRGPIEKYR